MRKIYVINDPKGHLWLNSFWRTEKQAWDFLHWSEDKSIKNLKKEGYTVRESKIWIGEK